MTTVDTLVSLGERIEAHAAREREPIEWRKLLIAVLTGIPYLLGFVVGKAVYGVRLFAAASAEGFRSGDRPAERTGRVPMVATASQGG